MEKYQCRTCGKFVKPKKGKLKCCDIIEDLDHVNYVNRRHRRATFEIVSKMFSEPMLVDYGQEDPITGELDEIWEGIPNS